MHIRIYQLDPLRGCEHVHKTIAKEDVYGIDPSCYNLVYDGNFSGGLEDIVHTFGSAFDKHPPQFHGHKLLTGDLIETVTPQFANVYHYNAGDWCNDGELQRLGTRHAYDLSKAQDRRNTIIGVLIEPWAEARICELSFCTDAFSAALDTRRYHVVQLPSGESLICHPDAFDLNIDCCTMNRMLRCEATPDAPYAALRYKAFFCHVGESVESLTPGECHRLVDFYRYPETFYEFNGKIRSLKVYPGLEFPNGGGFLNG